MSHRSSAPTLFAAAMLLIAGTGTVGATRLQAQEATMSPAVVQAGAVPASAEPAAEAVATPSPAVRTDAGPRIVPPFERYQPSLPGARDQSENSAAVAAGRHTIVISTLVLVLAVVIIVLLAVD